MRRTEHGGHGHGHPPGTRRARLDLAPMSRRHLLSMLTLGAAATIAGLGADDDLRCDGAGHEGSGHPPHDPPPHDSVDASSTASSNTVSRSVVPTADIALTIDDGYDAATVAAYVELARTTGLALTFNPIGKRADNWEPHAPALRPLIEQGQVQISNHTFNHLDLTSLDDGDVRSELERNEAWIESTFGVTSRPYYRPPSGLHDARVDAIAADLGFTRVLLWQGSFGDPTPISADQLLANARAALLPGAIVVGHANESTVIDLYPAILALIADRHLQPRTLDQMFRARGSVS